MRQLRNVRAGNAYTTSPSALQLSPPFALHSYLRPPPSALHSALSRTIARYLTHWTLVLQLLYLWLAVYSTYMAIYDTKVPDGVGKATPWFISATYAMQPLVLVGSLLVALLFWALVYEPGDGFSPASVAVHGVNFVVMLADLLLVRNPLYLSHVLVPMAYSIAYLLFSVLFYAVSGDNITVRYIGQTRRAPVASVRSSSSAACPFSGSRCTAFSSVAGATESPRAAVRCRTVAMQMVPRAVP